MRGLWVLVVVFTLFAVATLAYALRPKIKKWINEYRWRRETKKLKENWERLLREYRSVLIESLQPTVKALADYFAELHEAIKGGDEDD